MFYPLRNLPNVFRKDLRPDDCSDSDSDYGLDLSGMTNLLGAKVFVADLVANSANAMQGFLPMIIFLVAAFLAFATGTSWGTFSILIPIVLVYSQVDR